MPRQERPLDVGDSALLRFARELRALRERAGRMTYRELSARAHYSEAALSQAAGGRKLPSLPVTLAYVRACGGSAQEWERRWHETALAITPSSTPDDTTGSPYVGLATFQPEDADRFFGRERVVDQLVDRVSRRRVVVVVGASGAGKSSLLRAGLVPRVDRAVVFTPGAHPLEECAVRLARHLDAEIPVPTNGDRRALHRAVRSATPEEELVVVVDQFEEVFTLCQDRDERRRFIDQLVTAASSWGSVCRVVFGVRSDFYGHCTDYPALVEAMNEGQVTVGPMASDELRAAIVQPAVRTGHTVETALLTELVARADGQAGALPLLSHALRETWRRRRGNTLTLKGFQAAGGFEGALARTAESVFDRLSERQREIARSLFTRLTALGEGTEDTKRRILRDELDDDRDTTRVLAELTEHRLVTLDRDRVEISHEALIRCWPRLRAWLAEDRDGLRVHRDLSEAAAVWQALDRDPGALLRGARLQPVRGWLDRPPHRLTEREWDFLAASLAAEAADLATARRSSRRLRQLVGLLTVLLVFAAGVSVVAVRSGVETTRQRNTVVSQKVAREAAELRGSDPALAAQLALGAYRLAETPEARGAVLGAFTPAYATLLDAHQDNVNAVAFNPAARLLATASRDRTARLVDASDPHRPRELATLAGHTNNIAGVAFTADGSVVATASWDRTARLWDTATGALVATVPGHTDTVNAVAFSPDGRVLATASTDRTVRLWNVTDPHQPRPLPAVARHADAVTSLAFAPSGAVLATGGWDGVARLWQVTERGLAVQRRLVGHAGPVHAVAVSPDGREVATGGQDHRIRLWPVDGGPPRVVTGHTDAVRAVAFDPSGRRLVSGGADHAVRLWDRADPAQPLVFGGHTAPAVGAVFLGATGVATAGDDHTVRLWDLPGSMLAGHRDSVYAVAVAPSGRLVATAGYDRTVRLWDRATGVALAVLRGPRGPVNSLAFSPDGRLLVGAGADHLVHRWEVGDPRRPRSLPPLAGHTDAVNAVAVDPDGRVLATGGTDRTIRLWDAVRGTPQGVLKGHTDSVQSLAFAPDGHLLASASADFSVRLWNPHERRSTAALIGHTHAVKSVAFSPDGRELASGSADHTVRLWTVATGAASAQLTGHTDTVHAVAYTPDGRAIATASADRGVRLWNRATRTEAATLAGHGDRVYALAFVPDGRTLLSGSGDRTVRLWEVDEGHAAGRICAVAWPSLGEQTWNRYFTGVEYQPLCPSRS
jgi:WD40 repeat protein